MALRITTTTAGTLTTLKIDGDLMREGVAELEKTCESVDGPVDLDLSELMRADAEGVQDLKKLLATGAQLLGASPYIKLLLESEKRSEFRMRMVSWKYFLAGSSRFQTISQVRTTMQNTSMISGIAGSMK